MERYNEYKDSGVQWLGEIPSHWAIMPLKYSGRFCKGKLPSETNENCLGKPIIGASEMNGNMPSVYSEDNSVPQCTKNDILFLWDGANAGLVSFFHEGIVASTVTKFTCDNSNIVSTYLYYLEKNYQRYYKERVGGTTIPHMNSQYIASCPLLIPSTQEQKAIADYLNTTTAKIDEAIAQQQKMIDLLNERKQIIINNAVTKGLNPDAPMKDSGVDYIGLIPEHWVVRRMASLGVFSKGGGISRDNLLEEGEPAILYGDIYTKYNYFAEDIKNHVSKKVALASVEVHKNELLMTGSGETKEDIGKTIVFLGNKAYAGGDVIIFKQDNNNSSFLSYALNSSYAKNFRYKESKGEIVVHIYANAVRQLYLALPDITEQNSIVEYLNNKVGIIDSEICVVRKQISLLQERKQIIINDVVTGKVKVS